MIEKYQINKTAYIITKIYASGRVTNTLANIVSKDTEGRMCCLHITNIEEYCKNLYECNKNNINPNMRLIEVSYKEISEEV